MTPSLNTATVAEKQREAFTSMIGALLLNFGALEFLSHQWAEDLSTDKVVRELAIDMPLSKRVALIKQLVNRSVWPEYKKKEAIGLWDEVSNLAKIRNKVAHNPLLIKSEPDGNIIFGVMDVKAMKGIGPKIIPLVPKDIHSAGCRGGELIKCLNALSKKPWPSRRV